MADLSKTGTASKLVRFVLKNSSTGVGLTGLSSASAGLIISTIADNEATPTVYTQAGSTIESITTLGTFATPTATKCRFKEVDATNHPGLYEFQFANARYAVASAKRLIISVSGAASLLATDYEVQLLGADLYDAVRAGLTALPNVVDSASGGVSGSFARLMSVLTDGDTVQSLRCPGLAGNGLSTPDTAAVSITGDMDLRARVAPHAWVYGVYQGLISKWGLAAHRSFGWYITPTGTLELDLSSDGTALTSGISSAAVPYNPGDPIWVRVTWRASDGRTQFFTSLDGAAWTQLGTDQTIAVGAIFNSDAPLWVAMGDLGTTSPFTGRFYRAQVYSGIGGTLAFDADPSDPAVVDDLSITFTDKSANLAVITVARSGVTGLARIIGGNSRVGSALLDLADGVESGETVRQLLRLLRAVIAGVSDDNGSGTVVFKRKDGTTTALTVTHSGQDRTSSTVGTV